MNKHLKIFALAILATLMASCADEIVKSDFDYVPNASKLPSVTLTIGPVTGSSVELTGTLSKVAESDTYIEKGFVCALDADFKIGVITKSIKAEFDTIVSDLKGDTEYFVRSYCLTPDGVSYSEVSIFKTRKLVVLADVNLANMADYSSLFSSIDNDGDGNDWVLTYYDEEKTVQTFFSYSWYEKALTPDNYLLLPKIDIPTGVILPEITISLEPADTDYAAEGYKLVILDEPITKDNLASATSLDSGKLTAAGLVKKIAIPEMYVGKTVYFGLAHTDCKDEFALIYKGHKVQVTQ